MKVGTTSPLHIVGLTHLPPQKPLHGRKEEMGQGSQVVQDDAYLAKLWPKTLVARGRNAQEDTDKDLIRMGKVSFASLMLYNLAKVLT